MSDFHKLDPDHFDLAVAEAHGAIVGTMYGNGYEDEMPHLTPMLKTAYENAFKVVYNRGYEAAVAQWGTPPATVPAEAPRKHEDLCTDTHCPDFDEDCRCWCHAEETTEAKAVDHE